MNSKLLSTALITGICTLAQLSKKVIFTLTLLFGLSSLAHATISQIRWGTATDPLNGLTLTWSNKGTADSMKWGYTSSYEKGSFKGTRRSGYASSTYFFKYVFPTVTASTTIYYELYDSYNHSWGSAGTYTTAPPLNTNAFTFCSMGDCRDYPSVLTSVTNLAIARKPTFTLFNGDLTVAGNSSSQYTTFFNAVSGFLPNNLVFHAMGNHDAVDSTLFSNLWDLPQVGGSNLYYSFKYGNCLFITLNTNDAGDPNQVSWLQSTLSAANSDPTIVWKIVSCHHCFFTDGAHSGDMNSYRSTIWKAFDDYGVDLVLTGHDHNYQRSFPINLNVSSTAPVSAFGSQTGQGRCEIISGGAGASLYGKESTPDAWAMNVFDSTYNYAFFSVNGCKIKMTAYNSSNTIIDSLTFDKPTSCSNTTGIKMNNGASSDLNVFPNPTSKNFTLHYSSAYSGELLIRITDLSGREIISKKVVKDTNDLDLEFDTSVYPSGNYFISLNGSGNTIEKRILTIIK
jgi:hypothetical protein